MGIQSLTIGECLKRRAEETPDGVAIVYQESAYTWRVIDCLSDQLAAGLCSLGMRKGEQAGIWSVNHSNYVITFLALCKIGAIPVLINACYKEQEVSQLIQYTEMKYMFYGNGYKEYDYKPVIEQLKRSPDCGIRQYIPLGDKLEAENKVSTNGKENIKHEERTGCHVLPEDTACMMFTSGTTGQPKGVMLSHNNLVGSAIATAEGMGWKQSDKQFLAVPLFHCFGLTSGLLASIYAGCSIGIIEYYRTKEILSHIEKFKSTVFNGVPSMFLALIRNPDFAVYNITSLRNGIIAGAPIAPIEYEKICQSLPHFDLRQSYGQTETSPCVTLISTDDPALKKAQSVGRAITDVDVRIWDYQKEAVAEPNMVGEIQVRGYNVMQEYYKREQETKAVILPDGWLQTGDLGYLDQDGYLYISGRIKEMIIRAGENIMPGELERLILQSPFVQAVKVIGIKAEVVQEEIVACIIPIEKMEFSEERLIAFLKPKIAHYKIPSHFVLFEYFPRTASGKIAITELRNVVAAVLS